MTGSTRRLFLTGTLAAALGGMGAIGCSPISLAYFLFKGDGKKPATYPLEPVDKARKEIRVVIMATGQNLAYDNAGLPKDVANQAAKVLTDGTNEDKHPIKHIRPDDIEKYKSAHPNWRTMPQDELARELSADYLIDITITGVGIYQPNSANAVYEGWITCDVIVYQAGLKLEKYNYHHKTHLPPTAGDSVPLGQYKSALIKQFATELATRHMKHTEDSRRMTPMSQ